MLNSILSKKSKSRLVRAASIGAPMFALMLGLGTSAARANSIDISANNVVQSGSNYVYTYTFTIAEGENSGSNSYASVIDFAGLIGSPTWTPAASGGTVSTPFLADIANYTGIDSLTIADLEVKFTTNVIDPASPTAVPIVLGTLTATSSYNYSNGSYASFDNVLAGGVDPNHGGALVPAAPATPLPASIEGGLALLGALAVRKATKGQLAL